jgi:hypothetical protein
MKDKKEYLLDMYMFLSGEPRDVALVELEKNIKGDTEMTAALYRMIDQVAYDAVEDFKKQVASE